MTERQWEKISLASLCFLADALIELCQSPAANSAAKSTSVIYQNSVRSWSDNMVSRRTVEWPVAQYVYDEVAGVSVVIRAATSEKGECEDSETWKHLWKRLELFSAWLQRTCWLGHWHLSCETLKSLSPKKAVCDESARHVCLFEEQQHVSELFPTGTYYLVRDTDDIPSVSRSLSESSGNQHLMISGLAQL